MIGSGLLWGPAPVNTTVTLTCPPGATGHVTRACVQLENESKAEWEEPDVSGCRNDMFDELKDKASMRSIFPLKMALYRQVFRSLPTPGVFFCGGGGFI